MIPTFAISEFVEDCSILLERALLGKTVVGFGSDGNGLFGYSLLAKSFTVSEINVTMSYNADNDDITGIARIFITPYSSADCGHIATDGNLKFSVNKLLEAEYINTECWCWAPISEQGENYFTISFDVHKLLNG